MISVIIPYMAIPPYNDQVVECLKSLTNQTEKNVEVIVSEQEVERFININKLLNEGFEKAIGEILWVCGADFLLPENHSIKMIHPTRHYSTAQYIQPPNHRQRNRRVALFR